MCISSCGRGSTLFTVGAFVKFFDLLIRAAQGRVIARTIQTDHIVFGLTVGGVGVVSIFLTSIALCNVEVFSNCTA